MSGHGKVKFSDKVSAGIERHNWSDDELAAMPKSPCHSRRGQQLKGQDIYRCSFPKCKTLFNSQGIVGTA
jgi:hypothetical protein